MIELDPDFSPVGLNPVFSFMYLNNQQEWLAPASKNSKTIILNNYITTIGLKYLIRRWEAYYFFKVEFGLNVTDYPDWRLETGD